MNISTATGKLLKIFVFATIFLLISLMMFSIFSNISGLPIKKASADVPSSVEDNPYRDYGGGEGGGESGGSDCGSDSGGADCGGY